MRSARRSRPLRKAAAASMRNVPQGPVLRRQPGSRAEACGQSLAGRSRTCYTGRQHHDKRYCPPQTFLHLLHHHPYHSRRYDRFQDHRGQQNELARCSLYDRNHHHDRRIRGRDRAREQADRKALYDCICVVFDRHDPVRFYEPCCLHYRGGAAKGLQTEGRWRGGSQR